jgi:methionine-rich copper-binding protein CopC
MRRVLGVLVVAAAAALLSLGTALPAQAHAKLESSTPAAKARVTTAVTGVTLTFSERVKKGSAVVRVDGPGGAVASSGAPRVAGVQVSQALRPGLPNGGYTIRWKVTSTDGHQLAGTVPFTLSVRTAAATRTSTGSKASASRSAAAAASASVPSDAELTASNTSADAPSSSPVVAALLVSALVIGLVAGGKRLRAGMKR